jgi:hypothetical protein
MQKHRLQRKMSRDIEFFKEQVSSMTNNKLNLSIGNITAYVESNGDIKTLEKPNNNKMPAARENKLNLYNDNIIGDYEYSILSHRHPCPYCGINYLNIQKTQESYKIHCKTLNPTGKTSILKTIYSMKCAKCRCMETIIDSDPDGGDQDGEMIEKLYCLMRKKAQSINNGKIDEKIIKEITKVNHAIYIQ